VLTGQLLQIAGFAASVHVGLVFLVAAIDKLRHRDLLPGVIANYRLLPAPLVGPVAWLLPVVELLVALALLVGNRPAAPLAGIALLLLFAAAMAINIGRGRRHIDCGCGHTGLRQHLGWRLVARNLVMAAALGLRLASPPGMAGVDLALAVVAGTMIFVLTLMFNALKALPGSQPGTARG
jgi:uncharacterized membrane protein YphA (DoxX/SURF4 family)